MKYIISISFLFLANVLSLHGMEQGTYFSAITSPLNRARQVIQQAFSQQKSFEYPDSMLFPDDKAISFEQQWNSLMRQYKELDKYGIRKTIILVNNAYYDQVIELTKPSRRIMVQKADDFLPKEILVAFGFYHYASSRL